MRIPNGNIMSNLVFRILLLLIPLTVQASGAAPRLAKPNCRETCGDVTIPFPFGIGAGCFLDDWYEIGCQQNRTVPILKKIGLRVFNISLPNIPGFANGMINVSLPLIYSNASCGGDRHGVPVSLEGSQFVFSETSNIFTSVGCNTLATMNSAEPDVHGCRSICTGNYTNIGRYSTCSGKDGCCQTMVPFNLQYFSVDFKNEGGHQGCNYAFLADRSWFVRSEFTDLYDLRLNNTVRAVLEWGIPNNTNYALELIRQNHGSTFYNPIFCDNYSAYAYPTQMPFMQCYCRSGYSGNPYLIAGCQDINECEDQNPCPGMCVNKLGTYDCIDRRKPNKLIFISLGLSVLVLLQMLLPSWWLYKYIKKRREIKLKEKYFKTQWGLLLQQHLSSSPEDNVAKSKLFRFKDLEKATDRFNKDRILGQGGQGVVYKGMLTNGKIVAVKKSKLIDKGKVEEFINEVIILSQINHRNVVKLMGCCLETDYPLLVYEFIPNGTLYWYLHDPNENFLVSWDTRLRIAAEIAGALFGYVDPEYFRTSLFTDKSDVYSFGVVLAELLTGQKPICWLGEEEGRNLADYFVISMEQDRLFDISDARVMKEGKEEEITAVANLARWCLSSTGRDRPTMKEVAMQLEGIRKLRSTSGFQQNQGKIEVTKSRNYSFASSKFSVDVGITTFSDVQSFTDCETW